MLVPLALTMVFGGLLQALGMWALASRWVKVSVLYGALGLAYWVTLLVFGTTPWALLKVMPFASGTALVILLVVWMIRMKRRSHPDGAEPLRV